MVLLDPKAAEKDTVCDGLLTLEQYEATVEEAGREVGGEEPEGKRARAADSEL